MSSDAIKVIRDAEKAAEVAEKKAREDAAAIVANAHEEAKRYLATKVKEAQDTANSSLHDLEASNEAFMKKVEIEISEEVVKLRSDAEAKKESVVAEVNNFLF